MDLNIGTFVVRDDKGAVDMTATLTKFGQLVKEYIAARETEVAAISAAVHAVFDKHPGAKYNKPAVVNGALRELNCEPEQFVALSKLVGEFITANSSENRADGKPFRIKKGKDGGVARWSEIPLNDEEKKAAAEAAAAKPIEITTVVPPVETPAAPEEESVEIPDSDEEIPEGDEEISEPEAA